MKRSRGRKVSQIEAIYLYQYSELHHIERLRTLHSQHILFLYVTSAPHPQEEECFNHIFRCVSVESKLNIGYIH